MIKGYAQENASNEVMLPLINLIITLICAFIDMQ